MNRIKLRDVEPVPGSRWCDACKRAKSAELFGRTYCKNCERLRERERKSTPEARARRAARRDPGKAKAHQAKWRASDRGKATSKAWSESLRGRLTEQLKRLRKRLRRAKSPFKAERLRGLIADVIEIRERLGD